MRAVTVYRLDDGNNNGFSYHLNDDAEFDKQHGRQFARRGCRRGDSVMNGFLRGTLLAALSGIALALAGCGGGGSSNPPGASAPTAVVQPLPLPGPYAVACSNVVQNFNLVDVGAGEDVEGYWEGMPSDDGTRREQT